MDKAVQVLGNISGVVGVLACLLGGIVRLTGAYQISGIPVGLTFEMGVGLMVFACLAKLHLLKDAA